MNKKIAIALSVSFVQAHVTVPFHVSMQIGNGCKNIKSEYRYDIMYAQADAKWQLAEGLYTRFVLQEVHYEHEPLIPCIVHHIWLGSMMPDYAQEFRKTWITHNPAWTFIVWTDHPAQEFGSVVLKSFDELKEYLVRPEREQYIIMDMRSVMLKNQQIFLHRARNWGEKSDIARYEILYEIGGLYVDTDFECLRPFDDFHHCYHFYTGISHTREFVLYNGLIGSAACNSILREAIDLLAHRHHTGDSLTYAGPHFFTWCFIKNARMCNGRAVAFPVTYFYAWPHYDRHDQTYEQARNRIEPESYALHYWKVSWLK